MGFADWFVTYTNGILCEHLPIPAGLSDYHIMLYQQNRSYKHLKSFQTDIINGYRWRRDGCLVYDYSDFPGFINYTQEKTHNKTLDATSQ